MNTSSGSITLKKLLESEQINKFIINGTDHAINVKSKLVELAKAKPMVIPGKHRISTQIAAHVGKPKSWL